MGRHHLRLWEAAGACSRRLGYATPDDRSIIRGRHSEPLAHAHAPSVWLMEWKRPATAEPWAGGEGQAGRQALQRPALWAVAACRERLVGRACFFFGAVLVGGAGGAIGPVRVGPRRPRDRVSRLIQSRERGGLVGVAFAVGSKARGVISTDYMLLVCYCYHSTTSCWTSRRKIP